MRPILIVALVSAVFVAGLGLMFLRSRAEMAQAAVAQQVEAEHAASKARVASDGAEGIAAQERIQMLESRLGEMSNEIATLTAQMRELRDAQNREPALAANDLSATAAASATPVQREAVLKILEEERDRQAKEREATRLEREKEVAKTRAARVAKELSMAPADEARLAELMVQSNAKRQELFDKVREDGFDRENMRTSFEELRKWQTDQLSGAFGPALAEQIEGLDRDRMGFGGGFPGGGFPGGNNGGQGGGRGGRRAQGGNGQTQNTPPVPPY